MDPETPFRVLLWILFDGVFGMRVHFSSQAGMISTRTPATIILATWGVLLALYALDKYITKIRFLKAPIVVDSSAASDPRPGSILAGAGVLFVFVVNIATVGMVLGSAWSPSVASALSFFRFVMPPWVQVLGGLLFVLYSVWGLLVLYYNPHYTPLYKHLRGRYVVATEGPYRLVRHPRYAAEALANLILFLFTGFWLSLLGIVAWAAIYAQAQAEERFLLTLAPEAYGDYCRRTGMLFPRLRLPARPG